MYTVVLVLHIIVSTFLVAIILLQAGRGGGLAQTFGGGGATTIFGQKASVFLTRATSVSAILFLCTSLLLGVISSKRNRSLMERVKIAPVAEKKEQAAATKTVREVRIDPKTGKEEVISEKQVPLTEEEKESVKTKAEVPAKGENAAK